MRHKYYNQSGNVMKCNGQYVTNDPCFPVCSLPDGSGCDWAGIYGGGIGGPAEQHTITTGNAVTGNTSTRTVTPMIDPYQSIVPSQLSFDGSNREELTDMDGSPSDLWFNQSGDNVIEVGGHKYAFEPVLSWRPTCDTMDDSGDGIFTNQNCSQGPGIGGVSGLGVSALRFKDGKMY
tara:strand:+ start:4817 stop:5347 length:531 start_codon:yes stop_codon:yes gene_type:complete